MSLIVSLFIIYLSSRPLNFLFTSLKIFLGLFFGEGKVIKGRLIRLVGIQFANLRRIEG